MVYVIAEAGCNHLGDMNRAQRMIEAAALAGANCVKFQTYDSDVLVGADDIREFCRSCELSLSSHERLIKCCADNGVNFLSSAFDLDSLHMLAELGVPWLKIPSGQIHNEDYLIAAKHLFGHRIYLPSGMCTWDEWARAMDVLRPGPNEVKGVTRMHCVTGYPVPLAQANMWGLRDLACYSRRYGYSDHTMSNTTAIMAVMLSCRVIEHHFYLDEVNCPDMPASFCIAKLSSYIRSIRDAEFAMGAGDHEKIIQPCEEKHLKRRDVTRYAERHGDTRTDISESIPASPEVPGHLRNVRGDGQQRGGD